MADISSITLPNGNTYNIKDSQARAALNMFTGGNAVVYMGTSSTPLTNGGNQNPTVNDNVVTDKTAGQLYFYGTKEYLYGLDNKWHELGNLDSLGALALKNKVKYDKTTKVTYGNTSSKTASISLLNGSVSIAVANDSLGNYTPAGTVSQPSFTGTAFTSNGTFTPHGSVTVTTKTASTQTIPVRPATSGTITYTPTGEISQPEFSDGRVTANGIFTPAGEIVFNNNTITAAVSPSDSGAITYTPNGSVSTPVISLNQAGSSQTIRNPTSTTVVKSMVAAAPGATAPANNLDYYVVEDETLNLYQLGYTTGASITTTDVTVKTGDASYSASKPTWTGTGVRLVAESFSQPVSAIFRGTPSPFTVTGTATGTVSQPSFTGSGVRLITDNISIPNTYKGVFTGAEESISVSGTPTGTISKPIFSGTRVNITGNINASGDILLPDLALEYATTEASYE